MLLEMDIIGTRVCAKSSAISEWIFFIVGDMTGSGCLSSGDARQMIDNGTSTLPMLVSRRVGNNFLLFYYYFLKK